MFLGAALSNLAQPLDLSIAQNIETESRFERCQSEAWERIAGERGDAGASRKSCSNSTEADWPTAWRANNEFYVRPRGQDVRPRGSSQEHRYQKSRDGKYASRKWGSVAAPSSRKFRKRGGSRKGKSKLPRRETKPDDKRWVAKFGLRIFSCPDLRKN